MPSAIDAVKMLLGAAGLNEDVLKRRTEVAQVAELCKRLPLTIGVAGKLIRQIANGSDMSAASDWVDVVDLLQEELKGGDLSIEESVIRASLNLIPTKLRKQVTRLFNSFAMAPEDTHVPLDVLGLIYDACEDGNAASGGSPGARAQQPQQPISRLQVRHYLKVLLDRSLVLGTVDRPQLHDVMLEYVSKQFEGDQYKDAQRRMVELSRRNADRSTQFSGLGQYLRLNGKHHVTEAYDEVWAQSQQALSWLEDHVTGVQDVIAISTASMLPAETLAEEAEAAKLWWQAALRWNAFARHEMMHSDGCNIIASEYLKKAVNASSNVIVVASTNAEGGSGCTQDELDLFEQVNPQQRSPP